MKPVATKDIGFKKEEQRLGHDTDRADLVGQGRQAQHNALGLKLITLTIEGLVQAVFLESQAGQEVGSEHPPRRDVEGRWRLADLLAITAGDLLAHRTDHLVTRRYLLERFGDDGGKMAEVFRTAARALLGRRNDDIFARYAGIKVAARRPFTGKGGNRRRLGCRYFAFNLGGIGISLEILEGQF